MLRLFSATTALLFASVVAAGTPQGDVLLCTAFPSQLPYVRSLEDPTAEAEQWFQGLCDAAHVDRQQFGFYITRGINNAYASNRNGNKLIVYDPNLLKQLDAAHQNGWAGVSVIAHELGHHVRGMNWSSRKQSEAQADFFAGYLMHKLGASEQDAIDAIEQIADPMESVNYPSRDQRINLIVQGWEKAENE